MTNEDSAGLKTGDEVFVKMKIINSATYGKILVEAPTGYATWLSPVDIHSIAPPRPLEVGEWANRRDYQFPVQVIGIHDDFAWTLTRSGIRLAMKLNILTRCVAPQ